jgi:hypothetical protein
MAQAPELDFDAFVKYTYAFDRQSRIAFENTKPVAYRGRGERPPLQADGPASAPRQRGQGELAPVSAHPRITEHGRDTLQIAMPQVFIVNSPTLNAATLGTNDDSFIMVHSALVDHYSDEELLTVIGHECGHIHNSHVAYLTALHYLTYMAGMFLPWILQPALVALRTWSRRAEITCDRAGMLVVKTSKPPNGPSPSSPSALASSTRSSTSKPSSSSTGGHRGHRQVHGGLRHAPLAAQAASWPCGSSARAELYRRRSGEAAEGLTMSEVDTASRRFSRGTRDELDATRASNGR